MISGYYLEQYQSSMEKEVLNRNENNYDWA